MFHCLVLDFVIVEIVPTLRCRKTNLILFWVRGGNFRPTTCFGGVTKTIGGVPSSAVLRPDESQFLRYQIPSFGAADNTVLGGLNLSLILFTKAKSVKISASAESSDFVAMTL